MDVGSIGLSKSTDADDSIGNPSRWFR